MQRVRREEILDFETYSDARDAERERMFELKRPRRIHVGEHLTFLFENADTMRYQIHEMIRAERIVREAAIQHEIDTYNGLLGGPGELACTLLIEIEEAAERDAKLVRWLKLPGTIYLRTRDGRQVFARYDAEQVGEERLSSVQYLTFPLEGSPPLAIGVGLDELRGEVELSEEQRAALAEDLGS